MNTTLSSTSIAAKAPRWMALSMVAGQLLFTLAWFILGFLSPGFTIAGTVIRPYSAISVPLSGLGLGLTGPFMNAAFVLSGLMILIGVAGIFLNIPELSAIGRWCLIALFALSPLGMIIDGIFTIESFMPHMIGELLGSVTPVIGFLVAGILLRQVPSWRRFGSGLLLASPLTLVLSILFLVTFDLASVEAGRGVAGLTERIMCVELAAWFVAMGWKSFQLS